MLRLAPTAFEEITFPDSHCLSIFRVVHEKHAYRKLGCASALSPQWIKGRLLVEYRNQHPEKSIGDAAEGSGVLMAGSS
jgi:hypothetical protein